jgi:hypothetical protein
VVGFRFKRKAFRCKEFQSLFDEILVVLENAAVSGI